jgi:diguanylate cyclase (GGDEF)-like protein/putative nucleotidyltransferase with HDIG domain
MLRGMFVASRLGAGRPRRPMLLALVFGVMLVLVGVTASALVAIASAHLRSATLSGVVSRDASLVELFVNGTLTEGDVSAAGPSPARVTELRSLLARLTQNDAILRVEIRGRDGRVLASDDAAVIGLSAPVSTVMEAALRGEPSASVLEDPSAIEAAGGPLAQGTVVQELLPIVGSDGETRAVVGIWRDADALIASLDATRRDIMLVTLAAGLLLAAALFAIFRAAQVRLARQHDQLVESARRDSLTGLLNHGTIVGLLAEDVEAARSSKRGIGVAIVDIDNFRLLNDTHGHDAADEVLLRVAALVSELAPADKVARYGPDEFLVVRREAGTEEMIAFARDLQRELHALAFQFGDSEKLPVTASVGISAYPEHGASVTDLLSAAVVAVAEAKSSGGDQACPARVGEEKETAIGGFDVLQGLVIAVDTKDRYTKRHSEDVARYAVFLARRMGLDDETCETIRLAGLLHDIGKIGIPDVVLRKPSKLTADEFAMFQQHVALGDAIVRDVPNLEMVRAGIRHHHERWDGRGYLEGLEGEEIPLIGRLLAVADAFSAMTTTRPYRKALPVEEAIKRLEDAAGTQLEESIVTAFIEGLETDLHAPMPGDEATLIWTPMAKVA